MRLVSINKKCKNKHFCIIDTISESLPLGDVDESSDFQNEGIPNQRLAHTVQLKCNFTHAWRSMHAYTQIFACKIQKVAMEIFIFTRRGVAWDVEYHETWSQRGMECCET